MAFLADGRLLVTEQHTGRVRLIVNGQLQEEPFALIENVYASTETGLLGITTEPDVAGGSVYVYYSERGPDGRNSRAVVLKLTERDSKGVEATTIIGDLPGSAGSWHVGGNLRFGPDRKLYISIGDTMRPEWVQDLSKPVGKILRVNADGSVPADNPFVGRQDADPRVYAYGFRNPYDFAFHPVTGALFAVDNGDQVNDEINLVEGGVDYGWPDVTGRDPRSRTRNPIWLYPRPIAPSGITFYKGERLAAFRNDLFVCQFLGGYLHRIRLWPDADEYRRVVVDEVIAGGCTSDVEVGPDGYLYFMDVLSGTVYRIVDGER